MKITDTKKQRNNCGGSDFVTLSVESEVTFNLYDIAMEAGAESMMHAALEADGLGVLAVVAGMLEDPDYIENVCQNGAFWGNDAKALERSKVMRSHIARIEAAMKVCRDYWAAEDGSQ
jgi:hypothetical protein